MDRQVASSAGYLNLDDQGRDYMTASGYVNEEAAPNVVPGLITPLTVPSIGISIGI
jgi:hypothetical protein